MATKSTNVVHGPVHADERAHVTDLLARYPDLSARELDAVKTWFKRTAGPLDVGLLASDTTIADQYRAYRKDHHDRFSAKDIGIAALFLAIAACIVGLIAMMSI
ncbi:hypothetical protein V474_21050 [Novosphingobium barchaimii LL02]|uniref:Uncharacterized protein n=1 Tax=Novosphingobium barchaimii LL02 TaxID=1114963 RepID=A0A0J7XRE9_9SPHN|nr:hypothetical protein [Novosphingobium barchaimii]KMS54229.1 hypothetical protein V474_21050 [Novosphingobium barchaimii LL02]